MKNGFTLIELLGVIALLGIIILVAVPSLIQSNKVATENTDKELVETINAACKSYVAVKFSEDEKQEIFNDSKYVSINDLISNGYLKDNLKDSKGNLIKSGDITVKTVDGEIICDYKINATTP